MTSTAHPIRQHARILTASLVGTAVEFYDFYVYATAAALVIGPLFFPAESEAAQTLASFMTLAWRFSHGRWARLRSGISGTGWAASPRWSPR
jgi:hypothetical protein